MQSDTIKYCLGWLRRLESFWLSLAAERRCAMRLDGVADRLAAMGRRINELRARLSEGGADETVDADFLLRDALKGLKDDIRSIRCQLVGLHSPQLSARMQRAFARLSTIAEETYACADKLQWEIGEHDQAFAVFPPTPPA